MTVEEADRLRVLHLLGTLRPSGMERMLVSAAQAFRSAGVDGVVVGQGEGHTFVAQLQAAGYPVRTIRSVRTPAGARELYRLVREVRPQVVHVHTEGFFLPTVLLVAAALRSGRIVHTVHNVFAGSRAWRLRRRIQTAVADRMISEVVSPSSDVVANERGFGRRTTLIWNWVDDRFFQLHQDRAARTRAAGPLRHLLLGNCNDAKNHEVALAAVLATDGAVLHLGDETGASAEERRMLDLLEQQGRLLQRGSRAPDDAMLEADSFLMPSRNEGMGVALAEAMTVGVPALIAIAPGLHWAAGKPGVTAVDLRPQSWEAALGDFARGARPVLGEQPIDFSPERGAAEYAAAYRRAAGRRRR